ncbi:hypothetical protein [Sphingomonas phage Carli]|nr:hypothetical protein [Sphingomonas phage Carli]
MAYSFNSSRPAWQFKTKRFTVSLYLKRDRNYTYDGDDEDGETQAKLDSGEFVAFDSTVEVELDGEVIAHNTMGGSVYSADEVAEFFTAHRDPDPMNRNCSIMRAARGANVVICHYFPGMVAEACEDARAHVRDMTVPPFVRESAR